jgi:hypothetical protein
MANRAAFRLALLLALLGAALGGLAWSVLNSGGAGDDRPGFRSEASEDLPPTAHKSAVAPLAPIEVSAEATQAPKLQTGEERATAQTTEELELLDALWVSGMTATGMIRGTIIW